MSAGRRPGTRLPDEPAYWEDLAARSVAAAFGARDPWWRGVSDAAFPLAASALLALLGGALLLDDRPSRARTGVAGATEATALTHAIAPDDPLLRGLLRSPAEPPPAAALLRLVATREGER